MMVSMAKRDYYDILGVTKKASADEIRKAHRKLVLKYHPDRNRDNKQAEDRFKEIQEAYDILSDEQKRKQYDEFGHAGVGTAPPPDGDPFGGFRRGAQPGGRGGHTQWRASPGVSVEDFDVNSGDFSEMFEQFFGARGGAPGRPGGRTATRGRRPESPRGQDIEHPVTLSFEQSARGVSIPLQIDRGGRVETIDVKIPGGVKDGSRIRIKGKGEQGNGEPGDIYIVAHVLPHKYFRREGLDIYLDVPLNMYEALLGTKLTVPTLDGQVTMTIPAGTSSGAKLRLKGHGIERAKEKGDQYVVIKVLVPRSLDDEDKMMIAKLENKHPVNARVDVGW
jgi:DnaJ-class molecular chaperone